MNSDRFPLLFENSLDAMVLADDQGNYLDVNQAACDLFGYSREQMLRMNVANLMTLQAPHAAEQYQSYLQTGRENGEFTFARADGEIRVASYSACRLAPGEHLSILRDITRQKRAEHDLYSSEIRFRLLVEQSLLSIQILSPDGRTLQVNRAWEQLWGLTLGDLTEYNMLQDQQLVEKGMMPYIQRAFSGEAVAIPLALYDTSQTLPHQAHKHNVQRWTQAFIYPVKDEAGQIREVVLIHQDITDQKRLEQQFLQAQKMEGIGRLAGGIAHDFNNLLSVILGYAEMVEMELPDDSQLFPSIQNIQSAASRAAKLTAQLLAFARKQVSDTKVLQPNDLIRQMSAILKPLIREDIELVTLLEEEVGNIKADPHQMEQVIVNLVVNARDALPKGGGIFIETRNAYFSAPLLQEQTLIPPGEYVLLTISDTGMGMTEEVKARLFEPFFTTKEVGKGTGLGLATVFGIVKQSGGYIFIESKLGLGTTVKVYLPRVGTAVLPLLNEARGETALQGSETILVVEDEALLRDLTVSTLERNGYRVLQAANGQEAFQLMEEFVGTLHLVVTDAIMPVMGGKELAERLQAVHPLTQVLYVSGYTEEITSLEGILPEGTAFLQKPFTVKALLSKVREVLNTVTKE